MELKKSEIKCIKLIKNNVNVYLIFVAKNPINQVLKCI